MVTPTAKIKAIMLYFANNTKYLGKIKLMKLFYFLDFTHVKEYGIPVTYDTYYHLEKGPIPSYIMNLVEEAYEDGNESILADAIRFEKRGARMQKAMPQRKFTKQDTKIFTKSELKTLEKVTKRFANADMKQIIEISHNEAPWKETRMTQVIPYSLAGKDPDSKHTEEQIEEYARIVGWA